MAFSEFKRPLYEDLEKTLAGLAAGTVCRVPCPIITCSIILFSLVQRHPRLFVIVCETILHVFNMKIERWRALQTLQMKAVKCVR